MKQAAALMTPSKPASTSQGGSGVSMATGNDGMGEWAVVLSLRNALPGRQCSAYATVSAHHAASPPVGQAETKLPID